MAESGCIQVGYSGEFVAIKWRGRESLNLIDFLCCDLDRDEEAYPREVYQLFVDRKISRYELLKGQHQLYAGDDYYELAYTLINEIIYQVIMDQKDGLAIHAAAVGTDNGAILLPGQSGFGKSTFTAWLVSRGYRYLTDELVILDTESATIAPLTRPISFKSGSFSVVGKLISFESKDIIAGPNGMMMPHRLLNQHFIKHKAPLSFILFPRYKPGAFAEITHLSGALGCARLMECYVNARNIEDHGISCLAEIIRNTPVYSLTYGSFEGLHEMLKETFPSLVQ